MNVDVKGHSGAPTRMPAVAVIGSLVARSGTAEQLRAVEGTH